MAEAASPEDFPGQHDTVTLDDERPMVGVAGLPASLIVTGLVNQVTAGPRGYTAVDYLSPVVDAANLLRERYAGDQDRLDDIGQAFSKITATVEDAVASDWGADLSQLGLDPASGGYLSDLLEVYQFFVVNRMRNARDLVYGVIRQDRRRFADRFRKNVEKRNQSTSEARRVFQNFDDVVVWSSMPSIVDELRTSPEWSFGLAEALGRLGGSPGEAGAGFLAQASLLWTREDFAAGYAGPALSLGDAGTNTVIELRARWLEDSPKKGS